MNKTAHLIFVALCLLALVACRPTLTGQQFKDFYDRLEPMAGTVKRTSAPPITGDAAADDRIRAIAVARGYRLRSSHVGPLVTAAGVQVDARVAQPLDALIAAARRRGLVLGAR